MIRGLTALNAAMRSIGEGIIVALTFIISYSAEKSIILLK